MTAETGVLDQLVHMSRRLGDPARDFVLLHEGNTSAKMDDATFLVKASGRQLDGIDAGGFVQVRTADVLALLEAGDMTDEQIRDALAAARVDPAATLRPSVETVLHAALLHLETVRFVAHTHPSDVNAVVCAKNARAAVSGRLFPDEIVVCGPAPAFVEYVDPGLPLARAVQDAVDAHLDEWGELPKAILMQSHGIIAMAATAAEVEAITAMCAKTCKILRGTHAFGGPNFLTAENVSRIHTRPDEAYRRRAITEAAEKAEE
ncbi:MAG: class II aldolase/adducin family protein [Armatimonadota bacterium]|jgi:rhamnose utilization protein RhaD (predicted bifunctional aldolase and dehydrogenase)